MRKVIILLILLGLSAGVNAAMMTFSADDVLGLSGSNSVKILVTADVASNAFALNVRLDGPIQSIVLEDGFNPMYTSSTSSNGTVIPPPPAWFIKGATGRMSSPTTDTPVPVGAVIYSFIVNLQPGYVFGPGDEYLTIDDYKGVIGSGMSVKTTLNGTEIFMSPISASVYLTPEPMTLALLGLGSLLLLRRK